MVVHCLPDAITIPTFSTSALTLVLSPPRSLIALSVDAIQRPVPALLANRYAPWHSSVVVNDVLLTV